jgi:predicted alpha/beta-fold hydrolase
LAVVDFSNRYTAPIHGYRDAFNFYEKASIGKMLKNIKIPSLIVQAQNHPFLLPSCMPIKDAEQNPNLFLAMPESGGHCDFMERKSMHAWAEKMALAFAFTKV